MKRRLNNKHTRWKNCFDYIHKFATNRRSKSTSSYSIETDRREQSCAFFYVRFQNKTLVIHNPAFGVMTPCSLVGGTNFQSVKIKTVHSSQMLLAANYQTTRFRDQKVQQIFQHVTNRQPASARPMKTMKYPTSKVGASELPYNFSVT